MYEVAYTFLLTTARQAIEMGTRLAFNRGSGGDYTFTFEITVLIIYKDGESIGSVILLTITTRSMKTEILRMCPLVTENPNLP